VWSVVVNVTPTLALRQACFREESSRLQER
jgi:hypothetical protein